MSEFYNSSPSRWTIKGGSHSSLKIIVQVLYTVSTNPLREQQHSFHFLCCYRGGTITSRKTNQMASVTKSKFGGRPSIYGSSRTNVLSSASKRSVGAAHSDRSAGIIKPPVQVLYWCRFSRSVHLN